MASLVASIEHRRSGAHVIKLAGSLDEASALESAAVMPTSGKMMINLSGVDRINSTGARDWVNWLATLERAGTELVLVYCSPATVAQLNRIPKFAGNSIVKSFHAPYHCAGCNTDKLHVLYVGELGEPPFEAPKHACDSCGTWMRFTEDPETYFAFLEQQTKRLREAIGRGSNPLLAGRDSAPVLSVEQTAHISSPRISAPAEPVRLRDSRPSLSKFQGQRASRQRMQPPPKNRFMMNTILIAVLAAIALVLLAIWIAI